MDVGSIEGGLGSLPAQLMRVAMMKTESPIMIVRRKILMMWDIIAPCAYNLYALKTESLLDENKCNGNEI